VVDVDVIAWEVEGVCWFKRLLTFDDFEMGAGGAVLLFSSGTEAPALSLFGIIIGTELSSDARRAAPDWVDAGFLLTGSGVIDRGTHLPPPLLGSVAAKSAAEEVNVVGPAE